MTRALSALTLGLLVAAAPVAAGGALADSYLAELVARSFFRGLLESQPQSLPPLCAPEVSFDGELLRGEALAARLQQLALRARAKGLRLRKLLVLSAEEALRRYGKPPERLRGSVRPGRAVVLARLNQGGVVAVLARGPSFWRVIALTD